MQMGFSGVQSASSLGKEQRVCNFEPPVLRHNRPIALHPCQRCERAWILFVI